VILNELSHGAMDGDGVNQAYLITQRANANPPLQTSERDMAGRGEDRGRGCTALIDRRPVCLSGNLITDTMTSIDKR